MEKLLLMIKLLICYIFDLFAVLIIVMVKFVSYVHPSRKLMFRCDKQRQRETQVIKSFRAYTQCRILVTQMNLMFKDLLIPGLYAVPSIGIVFALYVIIRLHGVISLAGLSFFVILLMDFALTIAIDLAAVGFVYSISVKVTEKWKKLVLKYAC